MSAIETIIEQGISENNANSTSFAALITKETRQLIASFLLGIEYPAEKMINFLLDGVALFGRSSTCLVPKPLLSELVGLKIVFDYLRDTTPTAAGQSGKKSVELSQNASSLPQKYDILRQIKQLQRTLLFFKLAKIYVSADIVLDGDTITFQTPQLLEVGAVVKIGLDLFEVIAENIEGFVYQLASVPSQNALTCLYSIESDVFKNAAFNLHFSIVDFY